jgi:hypothetical protein
MGEPKATEMPAAEAAERTSRLRAGVVVSAGPGFLGGGREGGGGVNLRFCAERRRVS